VRKLGATQYIDSESQNPDEELVKLGGAKIVPPFLVERQWVRYLVVWQSTES
jgi:hypothetical protein